MTCTYTCTQVHRQLAFSINNYPMWPSLSIECGVTQQIAGIYFPHTSSPHLSEPLQLKCHHSNCAKTLLSLSFHLLVYKGYGYIIYEPVFGEVSLVIIFEFALHVGKGSLSTSTSLVSFCELKPFKKFYISTSIQAGLLGSSLSKFKMIQRRFASPFKSKVAHLDTSHISNKC